tara:strand:+ start:81 stop:1049 length:969 start_codon:yes stop_codon:yes gene_type:complete
MGNTNSTLTSTSTHKPNHKEQTNDYRRKGNKPTMQKSVRKKTYREPVTEYSPYERLGLREDCSLVDLKKKYKKLAAIHHPDAGGNSKLFMEIVKSYKIILFEKKSNMDNRIKAPVINKEYTPQNKNTSNRENVHIDKDNFNNDKFNEIFRDYRIKDPFDKGYGQTMDKSEKNYNNREDINIERLTSLNKGNFNNNFNKTNKTTLVKYEEPIALYSDGKNNIMELGVKHIDDFSGNNYTDYKRAYNNEFFDPNSVKYKTYNSVTEYENERSKQKNMTKEESEYHDMMKRSNEQKELDRRGVQAEYDQLYEDQFNNLNKVFIKH